MKEHDGIGFFARRLDSIERSGAPKRDSSVWLEEESSSLTLFLSLEGKEEEKEKEEGWSKARIE